MNFTNTIQTNSLKIEIIFLINFLNVRLFEPNGLVPLETWDYGVILQWTSTAADSWVMEVGDLFKPQRFPFQSPWAAEIKDVFNHYATEYAKYKAAT